MTKPATAFAIYDTYKGTSLPGTYRLGIGNFGSSAYNVYPLDLSTGITYTVVIAYDSDQGSPIVGANLMINPSYLDFTNLIEGIGANAGVAPDYVFGTDITQSTNLLGSYPTYIGFSPYATANISNVLTATDFTNVISASLPVFGSQSTQYNTNYSGNPATFYVTASGVDLTYQWYDLGGALTDDGVNIVGSTNNILNVSNVVANDTYYVVVSDVYGNQITSSNFYETVITTPTAPFFPPNVVVVNATNNVFATNIFNDVALGTGPLYYQWYYAPTNTPGVFTALSPGADPFITGVNTPKLNVYLGSFAYVGQYFVTVSNSLFGGSVAVGPTNTLTELSPLSANMLQLHQFMIAQKGSIKNSSTLILNTNNFVCSGYVSGYAGFGNPSSSGGGYSEFFIQDTNGYGVEVYLATHGDTNTPPIGTYVTCTGELEVYNTGLELYTTAFGAIVTNPAPPVTFRPLLANSIFNDLVTNGLGTNALTLQGSLITLTNVVFYSNAKLTNTPGTFNSAANFYSNSYTTAYFTVPQSIITSPVATNYSMELYQFGYNYTNFTGITYSAFGGHPIPGKAYQLTGVYYEYNSAPEILPSRLEDYVTNAPVVTPVLTRTGTGGRISTITLTPQVGSTYSVSGSTNLLSGWTSKTAALGYYPTNMTVTFVETNTASAGFYKVSSP